MKNYSIKEASALTKLPESTLRYYERIGLIKPIDRNNSSKHRVYTELDIKIISSYACLNISGMSISKMKEYLNGVDFSSSDHSAQVNILKNQKKDLIAEKKFLNLKLEYTNLKLKFWESITNGESESDDVKKIRLQIDEISEKLRDGWEKFKK